MKPTNMTQYQKHRDQITPHFRDPSPTNKMFTTPQNKSVPLFPSPHPTHSQCSTKPNPIKFITSNGNVNENKLPYQSDGHPRPDNEGLSTLRINLRNYPVRMIIGEGIN